MTSGDTEESCHTWVGPGSRELTIGIGTTAEDLTIRDDEVEQQ
jgi:hypothetical protein